MVGLRCLENILQDTTDSKRDNLHQYREQE